MRASDTHADGKIYLKIVFLERGGGQTDDPDPILHLQKKSWLFWWNGWYLTLGEKADLTSSSQEPSRSWGAPASLITTPLERLRLKGWNQRPLSAHMAVKTTLHLQNSVVARKQEWSSNLVLLGWSSRLTFPLEGILEVIMFKTTIRIIIITINVDDIFYYYSNDLQFQEYINKMIAQAV